MNINFEEWLEDLLGGITTTANSLLHLVQGELGGVQESLVH